MQEKIRMMLQNINPLLTQYDLGDFSNLKWAEGGFTNENYIIETSKGKHFLKKYLRGTDEQISREHALLAYLKDQNFPVPGLIKNNSDKTLTEINNGLYTFYEYVPGHTRVQTNSVTDMELINVAKTLAHYHLLAKNIPIALEPRVPIFDRNNLQKLYSDVANILKEKEHLNEFDYQIKNVLSHKSQELNEIEQINTGELPSLLIHGDFHAANLKFNEAGQVLAVFDWELAKHQPRIWEVICAMAFCAKTDWTWNFVTPINFERADLFLKSYHSINPLTEKEIEVIPNLLKLAASDLTWPLKEHYIHQNLASDRFLPRHADNWFFWNKERITRLKTTTLDKLSSLQESLL